MDGSANDGRGEGERRKKEKIYKRRDEHVNELTNERVSDWRNE